MNTRPVLKTNYESTLGLIAGNGQFPLELARRAREQDISVISVAHRGETDQSIQEIVVKCEWVYPGQLGKIIKVLKKNGVKQAVFAGGLTRTRLFKGLRPDLKALMLMARLKTLKDDVVLRAVAEELEKSGIEVVSAAGLLPESVPQSGVLTARPLNSEELEDALIGWESARQIGKLDIGQTVVTKRKTIVAVEAVEGTDRAIKRASELSGEGCVVVKLCKPQQDTRIDLPAIGIDTIAVMKACGASALIIEANKTLILNPIEVVRLADQAGIAIEAAVTEAELRERKR